MILTYFILRSRLSGLRLMVVVALVFYGVKTFTSMLEAWYFMTNIAPEELPGLFLLTTNHSHDKRQSLGSWFDRRAAVRAGTEIPVEEDVMEKLNFPRIVVILVLALIGWALCGAIMWIGMAVTSMENTLIIHAIGAPVIFWAIASIYFRALNYTTPLQTAIVFVSVVVFMDFFVVALLIEKSFSMFASLLGTWIPFALIFTSTYLTGIYATKKAKPTAGAWQGER